MADYTCNDCQRYDRSDVNRYDECYCTEYRRYFPKSDRRCAKYFELRNDINTICFLTTAMCDIFKMEDNCAVLDVMRWFRDSVLVNAQKYHTMLAQYEIIGPIISQKLYLDEKREDVAEYYFENYIYDIVMNLSTRRDYNEAVEKYVEMVNDFKRMYGVTREVTENDVNSLSDKIQRKEYKVKKLVRTKDE